jgi:hypothetical protein
MRNRGKMIAAAAVFVLAATAAQINAKAAPQQDGDTMVIVLKNGKQQSFSMSEVARIEFNSSTGSALVRGRARFLGDWTVGDGTGGSFTITLKPDGSAHKTTGGPNGTWTVVNSEAQITWEDGWRDAIRKAGTKFEKAAYSPGHTFSDKPDNVADAQKHSEPN